MRCTDFGARQVPAIAIDSANHLRCSTTRFFQSNSREQLQIGKRHTGQSLGRRPGVGSGHVGYAVVDHAVLGINGILVGGGTGRLNAAPLIDGNVYQYGPFPHEAEHFPCDELRSLRSGNEDGTDQQINSGQMLEQRSLATVEPVPKAAFSGVLLFDPPAR